MSEPRFLCDEMLQRLGRWLRAAGYDTAIAQAGEDDRELVNQANADERLLLTRDRHLARFRNGQGRVVLLASNSLTDEVAELSGRCAIDWSLRPFTRCLECNTLLVPASEAQRQQLPEGALRLSPTAWFCPCCNKLYWEGSHVRRMRHTLENFSRQHWVIASD
ncbi:MAG TPA: DUF5615 family PIN-like protein [Gammaproteobacteria bacterium]